MVLWATAPCEDDSKARLGRRDHMGESSAGTGDQLLHFLLFATGQGANGRGRAAVGRDCLTLCSLRPHETSSWEAETSA